MSDSHVDPFMATDQKPGDTEPCSVCGRWAPLYSRRMLEQEVKGLRIALLAAALPLETLNGQINVAPEAYRVLSPEIQRCIRNAVEVIRATVGGAA